MGYSEPAAVYEWRVHGPERAQQLIEADPVGVERALQRYLETDPHPLAARHLQLVADHLSKTLASQRPPDLDLSTEVS